MVKKPPAGDRDKYYVLDVLERKGVAKAQRAYEEQFGVAHDSKQIDNEIKCLFDQALDAEPPLYKVQIHVNILLALILREGGAGRGPGQTINARKKYSQFKQLIQARELKEHYKKNESMSASDAEDKVVADFGKSKTIYPVSESQIRKSFKNGGVYGRYAKKLGKWRKR